MRSVFATLNPGSDEQRQNLAQAKDLFGTMIDLHVTMVRSLLNPIPSLLFNSVIGWSCLLFFSYGLLSAVNLLTAVMATLAALSISSAAFLILELSDPYVGFFRVAPTRFDRLMQAVEPKS